MITVKVYEKDQLIDEGRWLGSAHGGSELFPNPEVTICTGNDFDSERKYIASDDLYFEEYQYGVKVYDSKSRKDATKYYCPTNEQWEKKY